MAATTEAPLFMKLVVSKESNKVLYAEIDSDFADVLLSFLTLPLGTIVRLLFKHYGNKAPILGSLNSLYLGLVNLDSSYFWTYRGKMMLLYPRNPYGIHCGGLKLQIDDTPSTQYFTCQEKKCLSLYYQANCFCSASTNTDITKEPFVNRSPHQPLIIKQTSSFVLSDDLQILLNSPMSIFRILKLSGIQDTHALVETSMIVGLKEIMELLKRSLLSKTPLTDTFLSTSYADETMKAFPPAKYESDALPGTQTDQNKSSFGKKFKVKALVQESTKRVLLAQTGDDFIDFVFSFLTYPLGSVQLLLGNDTFHGSISNLYRSISTLEIRECMKFMGAITRFLDPKLPPCYLSSSQILYLSEFSYPTLYRRSSSGNDPKIIISTESRDCCEEIKKVNPKGGDSFVKGPALFIVTDDLAVSSAASISIISTLNRMKIPISDIEEMELEIGVEEALSILRACLTSTYALTEGLRPFLKSSQVPKQEQ